MGNQTTRGDKASRKKPNLITTTKEAKTSNSAVEGSPTDSGYVAQSQFLPIKMLTEILTNRARQEESINGVSSTVFKRYLFPRYPDFSNKLFKHLHRSSDVTPNFMDPSEFQHQVERFLQIMNDRVILNNYVRIFSVRMKDSTTPEDVNELLMTSYQLVVDTGGMHGCSSIQRIVDAVLASCFEGAASFPVNHVCDWLWEHSPRIIQGLHRYVVHVLATAYRSGDELLSREVPSTPETTVSFEELLEYREEPWTSLPISHVWLLSTSLPACFIQNTNPPSEDEQHLSSKLLRNLCPRHWVLLYNSGQHGSGANRFLHHVLGYKSPTLLFIRCKSLDEKESLLFCICSAVEWRESQLYWGDESSMIIKILPNYQILEKGSKLLYLNTSIRGYPKGLRAGTDYRNPCVSIDESFHLVTFQTVQYSLLELEVWGCGDSKSREHQLDVKKWQVKEAEKQRIVKMSASDWLDHPDRYLLELAGRSSYTTNNN
ncbi:uncharacterized protein LOC105701031 [Orussus abietinus]|uniref:uncharacterized protein LOC105701031 n=1 Tax=Orussus abietinus TaxID=222816 RepID=UPI000625EF35|nr:uncharacterized protein LOC105701031 [Orussus abietinus]